MNKNLILALILLVGLFTGCSDDDESTVAHAYTFGITKFETGALGDLTTITNYLKSKGCVMESQTFTGKDRADTDRQAKELFEKSAAKISVLELDQLGLSPNTSFSYTASRYNDPTNPDSGIVDVGIFTYP